MKIALKSCVLSVALALAGTAFAQTSFEVATIKPAAPLDPAKMAAAMQAGKMPKVGPHVEGSTAEFTYMDLKSLIAYAYNTKPFEISGPDWMSTTRFDITAKMPEGASKKEAPALLQALLKDRFKLTAHTSNQEQPVLALVVAKTGSKLTPSTETPKAIDESAPLRPNEMQMDSLEGPVRMKVDMQNGSTEVNMGVKGTYLQKMDMQTRTLHISSNAVTMQGFAEMITQLMQMGGSSNRQVVDQTGLKGYYAISLDISLAEIMAMARSAGMDMGMAPAAAADDAEGGQSVLESIQALGLKLDNRKATVNRLVIDNVLKTPTEN